jgi:ABC-type glycerol-3-phosphate transport system permease component
MIQLPSWSSRQLRWVAAAIVVFNGFFPAVWILLTSLKREIELVQKPITYWPHHLTIQNYVQAFTVLASPPHYSKLCAGLYRSAFAYVFGQ